MVTSEAQHAHQLHRQTIPGCKVRNDRNRAAAQAAYTVAAPTRPAEPHCLAPHWCSAMSTGALSYIEQYMSRSIAASATFVPTCSHQHERCSPAHPDLLRPLPGPDQEPL